MTKNKYKTWHKNNLQKSPETVLNETLNFSSFTLQTPGLLMAATAFWWRRWCWSFVIKLKSYMRQMLLQFPSHGCPSLASYWQQCLTELLQQKFWEECNDVALSFEKCCCTGFTLRRTSLTHLLRVVVVFFRFATLFRSLRYWLCCFGTCENLEKDCSCFLIFIVACVEE